MIKDFTEFVSFEVNNTQVNLLIIESDYGNKLIAEIDNKFYHLGDAVISMESAIKAWEGLCKDSVPDIAFR